MSEEWVLRMKSGQTTDRGMGTGPDPPLSLKWPLVKQNVEVSD